MYNIGSERRAVGLNMLFFLIMVRVLFLNGGSGGHFYPMLAVIQSARELAREQAISFEPIILSPNTTGLAEAARHNIKFVVVPTGKLRRYRSVKNITDIAKTVFNTVSSLGLLWWWMPDAAFGNGGYGSLPSGMVSWLYRIPLFIHESDARVGLTNRILMKLASRTSSAFEIKSIKTSVVGNPVRTSVLNGDEERARKRFQINSYKPVLLILGGSQGAEEINKAISQIRDRLLGKFEIVHQVGTAHFDRLRAGQDEETAENKEYHILDYLDEEALADAYQLASIVIARAGSATIFELAALGKPSVLIPLQGAAGEHQRANAYQYARHGATLVVEEPNTSPHILVEQVFALIDDQSLLEKMSTRAKEFARLDAAQQIAKGLLAMTTP